MLGIQEQLTSLPFHKKIQYNPVDKRTYHLECCMFDLSDNIEDIFEHSYVQNNQVCMNFHIWFQSNPIHKCNYVHQYYMPYYWSNHIFSRTKNRTFLLDMNSNYVHTLNQSILVYRYIFLYGKKYYMKQSKPEKIKENKPFL